MRQFEIISCFVSLVIFYFGGKATFSRYLLVQLQDYPKGMDNRPFVRQPPDVTYGAFPGKFQNLAPDFGKASGMDYMDGMDFWGDYGEDDKSEKDNKSGK